MGIYFASHLVGHNQFRVKLNAGANGCHCRESKRVLQCRIITDNGDLRSKSVGVAPEETVARTLVMTIKKPSKRLMDSVVTRAGALSAILNSKRMFEKCLQIKSHGTRTRVRPSCWRLEWGNIVGET